MKRSNLSSFSSDKSLLQPTIQSSFRETTRSGKRTIGFAFLVLTPRVMVINEASCTANKDNGKRPKIPNIYANSSLQITVFKKTERHTLKICFDDDSKRYFELEKTCGKRAIWTMWCKQVMVLHQRNTNLLNKRLIDVNSLDWNIVHHKWKPQHFMWTDKNVYLGSKREEEDISRPCPVSGLGPTEDIQLLYLKPQYFGCWDQSEHWVQCESNSVLNRHVEYKTQ